MVDPVHAPRSRGGRRARRRSALAPSAPGPASRRASASSIEAPTRAGTVASYRTCGGALFPVVMVLLLVQENLEHLATAGHAAGLEPIASPLAVLAIALAVLGVAGLGALVRWRISEIEARLATASRRSWPRSTAAPVPPHSWMAAAFLRHRRLLIRDDPGRAPPALVLST